MKTFEKLSDLIDSPKESTCVFFFVFFLIQEAGLFPGVFEFVVSGDRRHTDRCFLLYFTRHELFSCCLGEKRCL